MGVHCAAKEVTLLDYGAGNVRSVRNAIKKLGYTIRDVSVAAIARGDALVWQSLDSSASLASTKYGSIL